MKKIQFQSTPSGQTALCVLIVRVAWPKLQKLPINNYGSHKKSRGNDISCRETNRYRRLCVPSPKIVSRSRTRYPPITIDSLWGNFEMVQLGTVKINKWAFIQVYVH